MTKREKNVLILILGFIAALGPFSIDMYLPSFPQIAEDLNTQTEKVSYTLTSYFIGISFGQLVYGPIVDRYGRKKPLLIGLCIFIVASVCCAFAPDIYSLVILRLFLALGGCVGMVASRAIVRDRFEDREIAKAFSSLILVMGVAPIVAPTIGGYVSASFGWEFIFLLLGAIAVVLFMVIYFFLDESKTPDSSVSLNFKKVALSYGEILKNKQFLFYGIAGSAAMAGMFAYISGSPYVIMEYYGVSEKNYGWIFGLNAAAFILGSQVNRLLLKKYLSHDLSYFMSFILLVIAIATLVMIMMIGLSYYAMLVMLFVFMFISGIINPNTSAMALMPFTQNAGAASALIGGLRMVSGVIASGVISLLHNDSYLPMILFMIFCSVVIFALMYVLEQKRKKGVDITLPS